MRHKEHHVKYWTIRIKKTDEGDNAWRQYSDKQYSVQNNVLSLEYGVSYDFKIRAHNGSFYEDSDILTVTPRRPGSLSKPIVYFIDEYDKEVSLKWYPPHEDEDVFGWSIRGGPAEWPEHQPDIHYGDVYASQGPFAVITKGLPTVNTPDGECPPRPNGGRICLLENNKTYAFRVIAATAPSSHSDFPQLVSPYSDWVLATPRSPDDPEPTASTAEVRRPEQPTIDYAEAGHRLVTITWTPPADSTVTGYQERHRKRGAPSWSAWADIQGSDGETIGYTWNGLENGTMYQFEVRAVNDEGPGIPSTTVSRRPKGRPPEAPTITDVEGGDGWVRVGWEAPEGYGITGWQSRFMNENAGTWSRWTAIPASDSTEHTFSGLTNGTRYSLQIRGVNSAGYGAASTPVRWRPRPPR